jgi:hypothetical protein
MVYVESILAMLNLEKRVVHGSVLETEKYFKRSATYVSRFY